jgi:hypothetical protein
MGVESDNGDHRSEYAVIAIYRKTRWLADIIASWGPLRVCPLTCAAGDLAPLISSGGICGIGYAALPVNVAAFQNDIVL